MKIKVVVFFVSLFLCVFSAFADSLKIHSFPNTLQTNKFIATVNGKSIPVFHAGMNVYLISFDIDDSSVDVKVTQKGTYGFWRSGATVRPYSKNIECITVDNTASFNINKVGQYVLQRANATSAFDEDVVLIFANPKEKPIPSKEDKNVVFLGAGIHYNHIDLKSGQTLYLDSGAVLFGSVNIVDAENVKVCGRGTILYYGPQSLERDEGFYSRKNWHPISLVRAKNVSIDGITIVNRSRTWTIHTLESFGLKVDNAKIVVTSLENINGDGIDWCGGGDSHIKNSFFRSADDCFAFFSPKASEHIYGAKNIMEGSVKNILIEDCVLWPTLANIFRLGADMQALVTDNVTIKNCDVIDIGEGGVSLPWSIFCSVNLPSGKGESIHTNYLVENLNIESPAALFGFWNYNAKFKDFTLRNVNILGTQRNSRLWADVENFSLDNVRFMGKTINFDGIKLDPSPKKK